MRSFSVAARLGSPAVIKGMNPFFPSAFSLVKESAIRPKALRPQRFAHGIYVFITATGKIHDQDLIASHLASRPDCVSRSDLSVVVLQHVTHRSLQHAWPSTTSSIETRCVLAQLITQTTCFHTDHFDRRVREKRMKEPDGIRTATDTGNQSIRQSTFMFEDLSACFAS